MLAELSFVLALTAAPAAREAPLRAAAACAAEDHAVAQVEGAQLAYRDLGARDGRPVILIGGTDQQLTQWPRPLLDELQARGFRTIVYDARDVGCSTHHSEAGPVNWAEVFGALAAGRSPDLAYDVSRLAADAAGLLDHLGIGRADVIGVSGGATVAGELAAAEPERVGRLVLVMANSGNPALPMPADPVRLAALPPPPAAGAGTGEVAAYRAAAWAALAGPNALITAGERRSLVQSATARSWDPDGIGRAGAAFLAAGDRRIRLAQVRAPTVVIHGEDDPLVAPAAGREVADAVPGARFVGLADMGHDLTAAAIDEVLKGLAVSGPSDE